jgi:hypothetical protein
MRAPRGGATTSRMKAAGTMLILAAALAGCAGGSQFYSLRQLDFVPPTPHHEALMGTWHATSGRTLALGADGRYAHDGGGGCWDADAARLVFVWSCVNYGATRGDPILAVAESQVECDYTLADTLVLRNCLAAGEYRRAAAPGI